MKFSTMLARSARTLAVAALAVPVFAQDPAGGDARVLQQVERDEAVVGARLRVVEDPGELREVRRPQEPHDAAAQLLGVLWCCENVWHQNTL